MTAETLNSHTHFEFGPCPKHFLEPEAPTPDLYNYIEQFSKVFPLGNEFVTGQSSGQKEYGQVDRMFGSFVVGFYRENEEGWLREYIVSPEEIELVSDETSAIINTGDHAYYISAHLRAAGIIDLGKKGLLPKSGH